MSLTVDAPVAVLAMALITLLTRCAGMVVMAWTPLSPRIERFLEAVSGSVLVALVAPAALSGGPAAQAAVLAAIAIMRFSRIAALAMVSGVLAAVAIRAAAG